MAALKNPHNETVALDIKVELSLGLISSAIHSDKVFWTDPAGNVGSTDTDPGCLSPQAAMAAAGLCQPGASAWAPARAASRSKAAHPCAVLGELCHLHDYDFRGLGRSLCNHHFPARGCSLPGVTPCRCASSQASQHTGCWGRYSLVFALWQCRGEGSIDHGLCWPSSSGGVD